MASAELAAGRYADKSSNLVPDDAATNKKLTDGLRKMGGKRPSKPASLWRPLKSFLGVGAAEAVVVRAVVALMPGLCRPWRLPAARGRAVALRVEPPGYRRLAPDGLPSLTQHGQAGDAG